MPTQMLPTTDQGAINDSIAHEIANLKAERAHLHARIDRCEESTGTTSAPFKGAYAKPTAAQRAQIPGQPLYAEDEPPVSKAQEKPEEAEINKAKKGR